MLSSSRQVPEHIIRQQAVKRSDKETTNCGNDFRREKGFVWCKTQCQSQLPVLSIVIYCLKQTRY